MNAVLLGEHAHLMHSAVGTLDVDVKVGKASGSQAAVGWVADVVVSSGPNRIGYGVTVTDPDLLEKASQVLAEAAQMLRSKRSGAEES